MFVLIELEEGPSMWVPLALVTAFKCPKRTGVFVGATRCRFNFGLQGQPRSVAAVLQQGVAISPFCAFKH